MKSVIGIILFMLVLYYVLLSPSKKKYVNVSKVNTTINYKPKINKGYSPKYGFNFWNIIKYLPLIMSYFVVPM